MSAEADRDIIDRIKDGRGWLSIHLTVGEIDALKNRAISEMANENALLRQALAEAAIPLEVLHGLGNSWRSPRLRMWWGRLVSDDLRRQIKVAVTALRETAGSLR